MDELAKQFNCSYLINFGKNEIFIGMSSKKNTYIADIYYIRMIKYKNGIHITYG